MIRITRPAGAPAHLLSNGASQTKIECDAFDLHHEDYLAGRRKMETSKRSIYAANSVKQALARAQHDKCCYCERKYRAPANLAVEHYRPKSGAQQSHKSEVLYPGYHWLAYTWDNLLLACHECNSTYKKSLFPIANPTRRARSHRDVKLLAAEHPLILDPSKHDPREHIRFRNEAVCHLSRIGEITIGSVGLDSARLDEDRREKFEQLESSREAITALIHSSHPRRRALISRFVNLLESAAQPDKAFSSMAQDFFDDARTQKTLKAARKELRHELGSKRS